jgi:hypothetical protein
MRFPTPIILRRAAILRILTGYGACKTFLGRASSQHRERHPTQRRGDQNQARCHSGEAESRDRMDFEELQPLGCHR